MGKVIELRIRRGSSEKDSPNNLGLTTTKLAGVTRLESVRMTAAIAAKFDLKLWWIDFVGAYLNSLTKEDIYMKQPEGFVQPGFEDYVCKLVHTIYGTMQGAHDWYETCKGTFQSPLLGTFAVPQVLLTELTCGSSSDNFRRFSRSGSSSEVFLFYFIFYFLMAPLLLFFPLRHISFIFLIILFRYI